MFEKAARIKLRFNYKGLCTVEDLWDIPLTGLDSIFGQLSNNQKDREVNSLLKTRNVDDTILDLSISIVKRIVEVRLAEREARKNVKEKAAKKAKLLTIISQKQDEALSDLSIEDLTKLVDEISE